MKNYSIPKRVFNQIDHKDVKPLNNEFFNKLNPHNAQIISSIARSTHEDIDRAVKSAKLAQIEWAMVPPVKRGEILYEIANLLKQYREAIAEVVSLETGKSLKDALGETDGAISLALFMAGEGQRLYSQTTTTGVKDKYSMIIREPVGIAGLIIAANTPIANIAWKIFPALICGNSAILKSAEDTPLTAWIFGQIVKQTNLPSGVLSIIHGIGSEVGAALVAHKDINLISFTGSTKVGREIARIAGERLAKVSLELGGKNALIVCDDADLENAVKWATLSAFSNAGQRCAAAGRIIVFDKIYDKFRQQLLDKAKKLKLGTKNEDDLGPVISERQLKNMLASVQEAKKNGAKILLGGQRYVKKDVQSGFYMEPTIIENVKANDPISITELFGPIVCLYKVKTFQEALNMTNDSPYGLTASIHTSSFNRATEFSRKANVGTVVINGGTYGSEPHMPFGGTKLSGNGTREPGTAALDVYSNLKNIYQFVDVLQL